MLIPVRLKISEFLIHKSSKNIHNLYNAKEQFQAIVVQCKINLNLLQIPSITEKLPQNKFVAYNLFHKMI